MTRLAELKTLSDRDLTMRAKTDREALGVLYQRYLPMIRKHRFQCLSKFRLGNNQELGADFEQDAFFAVQKAVNFVRDEEIYSEDWKFLGALWYYLRNLKKHYWTVILPAKFNSSVEFDETLIPAEEDESLLPAPTEAELLVKVMAQMSENQKAILALRREGLTLMEIKSRLGKSYGWVYVQLEEAKKKAMIALEITPSMLAC